MHHRFHFHFGRHPGARGLGRFGKGFMDGDGSGGRAFGMGRKLTSVDLQLIILALLAGKPHHGYEIIKALDERSKGFYVPSPGMVYPALTYLEEIGHAVIAADGTRKLYHITETGREHLKENRARADALIAQFDRVGERMDRVRRAMGAGAADDGGEDETRGAGELQHARRALKQALADKWDSPREEQQRVAEILERACAEIRGTPTRT
jgi:DNA-binding PadR family transcriptional regulator